MINLLVKYDEFYGNMILQSRNQFHIDGTDNLLWDISVNGRYIVCQNLIRRIQSTKA